MADTTLSANMSLPIPVVGVDTGPQYATDINACFALLDAHDHSTGSGVPITPAGLSINSDLPFNNNNLITARSLRMTAQASPLALVSDLGCLYVSGVDLYYNDGSGNQVRVTQSGGVAGSPGSIASLSSPASATYVSANQTFVWQSAASTSANMDCAALLLRNLTASSFACTLSPPAAMGANYSLTLPPLPASQKFMTLDASGNMGAPWAVDNSTLQIASSTTLQIKASGVGTTQIADGAVTPAKKAALGQQTSSSSGTFSTTSLTAVAVTNLSISITTTGRPVMVRLQSVAGGLDNGTLVTSSGTNMVVQLLRGATIVTGSTLGSASSNTNFAPSIISAVDTPTAGTYTYSVKVSSGVGTTVQVNNTVLVVYEL